jgi:hypothetical protein
MPHIMDPPPHDIMSFISSSLAVVRWHRRSLPCTALSANHGTIAMTTEGSVSAIRALASG